MSLIHYFLENILCVEISLLYAHFSIISLICLWWVVDWYLCSLIWATWIGVCCIWPPHIRAYIHRYACNIWLHMELLAMYACTCRQQLSGCTTEGSSSLHALAPTVASLLDPNSHGPKKSQRGQKWLTQIRYQSIDM